VVGVRESRWERERKGRVRESAVARLASKCERDSGERSSWERGAVGKMMETLTPSLYILVMVVG
jgi:hypothetical protein